MHLSTLHAQVRSLLQPEAAGTPRQSNDGLPKILAASERAALQTLRRRLRWAGNEPARVAPEPVSSVWVASSRRRDAS